MSVYMYLDAIRETAGFFIDKGNISISLANSLSFLPKDDLNQLLLSVLAFFPLGDSKTASTESSGWFKSSLGRKESEFAREMLMFPLSIKNPAVSLMASRYVYTDIYIHIHILIN